MDTRIRRAAFGLLLLLLLGSMTACKQTETIKVLQFNIWQEGTVVKGGFEAVADEIARTDADFVTLSEVRNYHDTRFCDRIVAALKERGKTYYSFYTEDSGVTGAASTALSHAKGIRSLRSTRRTSTIATAPTTTCAAMTATRGKSASR